MENKDNKNSDGDLINRDMSDALKIAVIESATKLALSNQKKFKYNVEVVVDAIDTYNDGKYTKSI